MRRKRKSLGVRYLQRANYYTYHPTSFESLSHRNREIQRVSTIQKSVCSIFQEDSRAKRKEGFRLRIRGDGAKKASLPAFFLQQPLELQLLEGSVRPPT